MREVIGCIADDFTGAADVAALVTNAGARCVITNDVPDADLEEPVDVIVVAMKIRSVDPSLAVEKVAKALKWLQKQQVTKFYYKLCSTFDSTEKGNIGPVMDFLMDTLDVPFSLVSPALPENHREVFHSYLFADGRLLEDGSMRHHPITPMTESYLPLLMERQSKYKCYRLTFQDYKKEQDQLSKMHPSTEKYYIIPDYFLPQHGELLASIYKDLKLLSGSSALIRDWVVALKLGEQNLLWDKEIQGTGKSIIFSGSLSNQTQKQLQNYFASGLDSYQINEKDLSNDSIVKDKIEAYSKKNCPLLIYSARNSFEQADNMVKLQGEIEQFFASMAKFAYSIGYTNIVSAGGETSGAIIQNLPFPMYAVIGQVATGVPMLEPMEAKGVRVVLKSGNFGQDDFFLRVLNRK